MLQLIPITSSEEEEDDSACDYLKKEGFDEEDIKIIKEHFDKEGIRYCIKTFKGISLQEIKEDLKIYRGKSGQCKGCHMVINEDISIRMTLTPMIIYIF